MTPLEKFTQEKPLLISRENGAYATMRNAVANENALVARWEHSGGTKERLPANYLIKV